MSAPQDSDDQISKTVGRRLRLKRELIGLSQEKLGERVGVSRIKIGQYESGAKPIPASILFRLAKNLQVEVTYFFNDEDQPAAMAELAEIDPMLNREAVSLLRDFNLLDSPEVRKTFAAVMERVAELKQEQK